MLARSEAEGLGRALVLAEELGEDVGEDAGAAYGCASCGAVLEMHHGGVDLAVFGERILLFAVHLTKVCIMVHVCSALFLINSALR